VKISGSYVVPAPPERAYAMLQDPDVLVKTIPGCDQLTRIGPDEYEMKMKMAISSVQGLFAGKVKIEDQKPPHSFKLSVEGTGKVGFMKGSGVLTLKPQEEGTNISFDGDVQVGGMIAGVGQRLVQTTAKFIIKKFFEKLAGEVKAEPIQAADPLSTGPAG
jgi:uncharacterized protein